MVDMVSLAKKARALTSADPAAAVALLREHAAPMDEHAERHAMALGQALVADCQVDQAVEHLRESIAKSDAPSVHMRKMLSTALLLNGEIDAATSMLSSAVADGLEIESLSFAQQHLLRDKMLRDEPGNPMLDVLTGMIMAENCVYDTDNRLALIYLGKNACSVLKATVVMNSPLCERYETRYRSQDESIHGFCTNEMDANVATELWFAPDAFRITVLRDPARRLLSAYLDKFLAKGKKRTGTIRDRNNTVRRAQAMHGIAADPDRSISFEEFCRFLAVAHDLEMNPHWMPQTRVTGEDIHAYSFIGHMEKLNETFELLKNKFNYVPQEKAEEHLAGIPTNVRRLSPTPTGLPAYRMLPAELLRHRHNSPERSFPSASDFLTPEMARIIEDRFSADVRFRREAMAAA